MWLRQPSNFKGGERWVSKKLRKRFVFGAKTPVIHTADVKTTRQRPSQGGRNLPRCPQTRFAFSQRRGRGCRNRRTSSIHTRPFPATTRFSRIRSGFCPSCREKGIVEVIQLMVPVMGRSSPREKNSPLPGKRSHISR